MPRTKGIKLAPGQVLDGHTHQVKPGSAGRPVCAVCERRLRWSTAYWRWVLAR